MTVFKRTSAWLCTFLTAAMIVATAQPAEAQSLRTRLDERALASGTSGPAGFYQWPTAPKKPAERNRAEMVVADSNKRGPLSLVILGAGVASGGVGVFFGMRNSSAKSDYRNAQTAAVRSSARDRAASAATVANVSWIASGVLLAAGLGILFFTDL